MLRMAGKTVAARAALVGACLVAHVLGAHANRAQSLAAAREGDHPEFVFPELHDDRDVVNTAEEQRWVYNEDGKLARSITSVLPAHNGILAHPPGAPGADVAGLGYDLFRDRFVHPVFDQGCNGDQDEDGPHCEFGEHSAYRERCWPRLPPPQASPQHGRNRPADQEPLAFSLASWPFLAFRSHTQRAWRHQPAP